jgi:predicted RNase H-like HicB family nuclease
MKQYLLILEKSGDGDSAYVPDLPGCTSAGADREEIHNNIKEAIKLHLEVMEAEGLPIPDQKSEAETIVLS